MVSVSALPALLTTPILPLELFRQGDFQQADGIARPVGTRADRRRQEHDVALTERDNGSIALQLPLARDAHQHARRARRADCERRFAAEPPHREMFTMKESLSQHRRRRSPPPASPDRPRLARNRCRPSPDRLAGHEAGLSGHRRGPSRTGERSRRCFLAPRIPRPAAQRVNGPGLDEDGVTGPRREGGQMVRHRPVRERPPQIVRQWCLASGPRRYGFPAPPPARPMLRSCRSRPAGSKSVCRSEGCTWTESMSRASRNFSSKGNRRKRPASFPSNCSGDCSSNCPMVRPLSGPSATRLGWSSRSLSNQASPKGPSPGSGAVSRSARRRPPQSRYW